MSKTKKKPTVELPHMIGQGVEVPSIPSLDKFINKYEAAKERRCAESPAEVAAKKELKFALQQQKESLPKNCDGFSFYRSSEFEKDYILTETISMKKHASDEDEE